MSQTKPIQEEALEKRFETGNVSQEEGPVKGTLATEEGACKERWKRASRQDGRFQTRQFVQIENVHPKKVARRIKMETEMFIAL